MKKIVLLLAITTSVIFASEKIKISKKIERTQNEITKLEKENTKLKKKITEEKNLNKHGLKVTLSPWDSANEVYSFRIQGTIAGTITRDNDGKLKCNPLDQKRASFPW